jgi:tight adherence protein C
MDTIIRMLIPILAAMSVFFIGGSVMLAARFRRERIAARLAAGTVTTAEAQGPNPLLQLFDRLGKLTGGGKTSRSLREDLARAGFHSPNASAIFLGAKAFLLLLAFVTGAAAASLMDLTFQRSLLLVLFACGIAFFLPNLAVDFRRRKRRGEITRHLPDAIDLLEISVTAGMGLDQAWNAVTDQVRAVSPHLADEMALTNLEIHLGASRPDAMRHMAERTGATELGSLVACLVQAERFGTSMRTALRNFASGMREDRSQKAQEAAEKMAIKLLFPMILFVFPPAVMVMAGPAFLSLVRALSGGES